MRMDLRTFSRMPPQSDRRATNVSLPAEMVQEAKTLGINLSRACEAGLKAALKDERERRWKIENAERIAAYNEWIEKNGIPLAEFQEF
jgi:antitoxin CcdA